MSPSRHVMTGVVPVLSLAFLAAIVMLVFWWSRRDPTPTADEIPRWSPEVVASLSIGGWAETFDRPVDRPTPLSEYDPSWTRLFGSLEVLPGRQVAAGTEGTEDGRDDYAFFRRDPPLGDVEITVEGWWGGGWRSLGVQGVVQPEPPHRLYEAALWEGAFSLFYFRGPEPGDYETLSRTEVGDLDPGFYRIIFTTTHEDGMWTLAARLLAADGNREVARVVASDDRLPESGYQGIGVLSGRRTFLTGIAVRALDP